MDTMSIFATVSKARALLTMADEYALSEQTTDSPAEKIETLLVAIEAARELCETAEKALFDGEQTA